MVAGEKHGSKDSLTDGGMDGKMPGDFLHGGGMDGW